MNKREVIDIWKKVDAVCFDVDSTVCQDEGIDVLAEYCGVSKKVKDWTNKAMEGTVTFRKALSERLNIINPSLADINGCIAKNKPLLTPGIQQLVTILRERNVAVYLVSGGLIELIKPVADLLGIAKENIFSNRLKFYFDGSYAGFDENQPTSESGGKPTVIAMLKQKYNYKNIVMVGDGVTDMEASPPADAFIGFGGNIRREKVVNNSKYFISSFQELIDHLSEL